MISMTANVVEKTAATVVMHDKSTVGEYLSNLEAARSVGDWDGGQLAGLLYHVCASLCQKASSEYAEL